ncbi:Aldo/keto reductase [Athelia psychrophila]|uniref:Aldo/keto reductase n=1 Tax=Athelia psychrophila TaxID=1759441 RepID=A0A166EGX6_9AGAM|nr:Aldo/keto reductase [Fibularhizoctonia sp. CBS 109695]
MAATFDLNSGTDIPSIGLGTWQSKPNEVANAVEYAIKEAGYRHIDGAWVYGNEDEVGRGIKASGVPRSEVFITSKLWCTYHDRVEEALDLTLAKLGTDYLDLYLIHWPVRLIPDGAAIIPLKADGTRNVDTNWKVSDTWKSMEALVRKGKVKAIGVSNFSQKALEEILPTAEITPAVNQLELHLYNPQLKLIAYLKSKGIVAQAYSPLGSTNSPLLTDETATAIAKKYELQTSDILLGYLLAKDIVVLPKSVTPARIASNYTGAVTAAKKLTKEDLETLDGVAAGGKQKRLIMPAWGVDLGFENWP